MCVRDCAPPREGVAGLRLNLESENLVDLGSDTVHKGVRAGECNLMSFVMMA